MISVLIESCRKGCSAIGLDSPSFRNSLPVWESDYPIKGDWYKRFEGRAASVVPSILLPNYLTIFRLAVSAFLMGFGARLPVSMVFPLVALGGLSDFFDGAVARARDRKTRFGVFLDPIADKLLMLSIVCIFIFQGAISPTLVILLACAEAHVVVIPVLSFAYRLSGNGSDGPSIGAEQRVRPSILGKAKMHLYLYGFLLLAISRIIESGAVQAIGTDVLTAGIVAACLALVQYVWRWARNPF